MDQRTRKIMMYKALHPRDDINRLYVSRKKEEEDALGFRMCECINITKKDKLQQLETT